MTKPDLLPCREAFEKWLTADGNYPHLKHKNFGGGYLNDEAAMKWDGWKTAWNARTPSSFRANERGDLLTAAKQMLAQIKAVKEAGPCELLSEINPWIERWEKAVDTSQPSPQSDMVAVPRDLLSGVCCMMDWMRNNEAEYSCDELRMMAKKAFNTLQPYTKGE